MRSRLRPAVILGVLMTALAAFVFTSSHASHKVGQKSAPTPTPPQYQPPTITLDSDAQVVTLCPEPYAGGDSLRMPYARNP